MVERVLVVGATGNIGVAAVKGALRSGRHVLALVRSQASADKLYKHVGSSEGITVVEADVTSDTGVQGVVDQVRAGKLPAFQHVYTCGRSCTLLPFTHTHTLSLSNSRLHHGLLTKLPPQVGGEYVDVPLKAITTERLRRNMNMSFEANFCRIPMTPNFLPDCHADRDKSNAAVAYRDTIEYLEEQGHPDSTWTICTGAQGELATFPLPAMGQGALFSLVTGAARENDKTNVRVNEVYLMFRVEVDEDAARHGVSSSSDFAAVYEGILARSEIRGARVRVETPADFKDLRFANKF